MKHLILGIAAHVDAGKTTLCEDWLCRAGIVRARGRVDHGTAAMDQDPLERERGITIFTRQASLIWPGPDGDTEITLLDTPGHADFIGQTERAIAAMDLCVLVVSARDGVQSGTRERLEMLRHAGVPVIVFANKMDQTEGQLAPLDLPLQLISMQEGWQEEAALLNESLMERYLEGSAEEEELLRALLQEMKKGRAAPLLCGSALQGTGTGEVLNLICRLFQQKQELEAPFAGTVCRCEMIRGQRVCFVRIDRGTLAVKDEIETVRGLEKVHLLQVPRGMGLAACDRAVPGQMAAVTGLSALPGEKIGEGFAAACIAPPMMRLLLTPRNCTVHRLLADVRCLEAEEPRLQAVPAEDGVSVGLLGTTQQEVLLRLLQDRFGDEVTAGEPAVCYRETVSREAVGIGHYEPLRHYAEVWLRIRPGMPGSGITFSSACPVERLSLNWQRLIRTHIFECAHPGILTGSPVTDIEVTLLTGRSHLKHTEGGDFREATCRALRQGLMQASCVLLEPQVRFEAHLPGQMEGRIAGEIARIGAQTESIERLPRETVLKGYGRLSVLWPFALQYPALSHGQGTLSLEEAGNVPCPNQEEIVAGLGYVPTADADHPVGSVFCSHGAGFPVSWDHVREWAHCAGEVE